MIHLMAATIGLAFSCWVKLQIADKIIPALTVRITKSETTKQWSEGSEHRWLKNNNSEMNPQQHNMIIFKQRKRYADWPLPESRCCRPLSFHKAGGLIQLLLLLKVIYRLGCGPRWVTEAVTIRPSLLTEIRAGKPANVWQSPHCCCCCWASRENDWLEFVSLTAARCVFALSCSFSKAGLRTRLNYLLVTRRWQRPRAAVWNSRAKRSRGRKVPGDLRNPRTPLPWSVPLCEEWIL